MIALMARDTDRWTYPETNGSTKMAKKGKVASKTSGQSAAKTEKKAKARKIGPAKKPRYSVLINGGNDGTDQVFGAAGIVDIISKHLIDNKERQVSLTITALTEPGEFAAQRVDGVK